MKQKKGEKTNIFFEVRVLDDYNKLTVNVLKCYALDTSSMNLTNAYAFFFRDKIGRCTVSERANCGFKGITAKQCVKDRGCCWDSSKRGVSWCFYGK